VKTRTFALSRCLHS